MLDDIVLDTNVLKHASDTRRQDHRRIALFLQRLRKGKTKLCVDPGFDFGKEANNRSRIGMEYLTHLTPGDMGYELVRFLASNERVRVTTKEISHANAKTLNQSVRDKSDRVFVRVACNAAEKLLASHDTSAFSKRTCKLVYEALGVEIVTAVQADERL